MPPIDTITLTALGAVVLLGLLAALWAYASPEQLNALDIAAVPPSGEGVSQAREHFAQQLMAEVGSKIRSEARKERWYRRSAVLLRVAQYVVGGALASNYVQTAFGTGELAIVGLLVLMSSLLDQAFHPETRAADARIKNSRLAQLKRESGLMWVRYQDPATEKPDIEPLLSLLTEGLNELEQWREERPTLPVAPRTAAA